MIPEGNPNIGNVQTDKAVSKNDGLRAKVHRNRVLLVSVRRGQQQRERAAVQQKLHTRRTVPLLQVILQALAGLSFLTANPCSRLAHAGAISDHCVYCFQRKLGSTAQIL